MGQPINFAGSNVIMRAPAGAENVQDMHVFQTRHSCVSCWELSAVERAEINQTGRIFLSVLAGGRQPPVYVGSESTCREVLIDFGPVWPMSPRAAAQAQPLPVELDGVADAIAYGKGFWRSCSGCHETNEGVPLGPFSTVMKCHLGMGCFECGGIGAIWDTADYEDMGRALSADTPVVFGLEAQGHIPAVEAALAEGADWQEIGRRIGWDGETAKSYYERHLARTANVAKGISDV